MKKVLIIDFELTCSEDNSITKENAEIIQIGLVEVMISDMSIRRTFMKYVNPENTDITEFCTNLTGITKKQVKNKFINDLKSELKYFKDNDEDFESFYFV